MKTLLERGGLYGDPVFNYNGGYNDPEDDPAEQAEAIHVFNPHLIDPSARLDTYREDTASGVGRDLRPIDDYWVDIEDLV